MKTIAQHLLLVLIGVIAAACIVEGIARPCYTKPWHLKLIEEQTQTRWMEHVHLNALGLRDREYPPEKLPSTHRVLILGDSFTFGSGVADDAAIFPELLEQRLNAEYAPRGESVEILNGGICGSLTPQWVELLSQVERSFQPDVILVVFFLRDGTRTGSMGSFFNPIREDMLSRNAASWWYRYSFVVRRYRDYQDRLTMAKKYAVSLHEAYFGDATQTKEWDRAKNNLLRIQNTARRRRANMGLVVFPVLVELHAGYPFQRICDEILDFAQSHTIPAHNLLPAFMGQRGPDLWVSAYDQHPNARGHAIAADSMLPFLKQLLDGL